MDYTSSTRPVSRRGDMTNSDSFTPSPVGSLRPGTSFRGMSARPPSSLRGGTASRLTANNSFNALPPQTGSSQRMGTALVFAENGMAHCWTTCPIEDEVVVEHLIEYLLLPSDEASVYSSKAMMSDRPITQHGLSGLPTSHGRIGTATGMRQIKDKRYWQAQLQVKMNEITKEIERLSLEQQVMNRERSAKRSFEKKVKAAAKELTNLQSQLTVMNIVLDSVSTGLTRQQMQQEATALRERNEHVQSQLETLFSERQRREEQNRELEQEIKEEKHKIDQMIYSLSDDEQQKYRHLQGLSEDLRRRNAEMHDQIEQLTKQKDRLDANITSSQPRMEATRLLSKLNELVIKRNTLRDEEANRLSPAQEREKLISEVRANNQALTSMNRQMKLIEDQLNDKREQLLQIEQDLEEGNSERHAKYKELKRRDETMTAFMDTFRSNMENEKQNIETLKNQITYAIEQITLQGVNLKSYGISKSSVIDERNDLSSHEGLLKEYKKLNIQLKQLQILERRTKDQLETLREEDILLSERIAKLSNLDNLRSEAAIKMDELQAVMEDLKKKEHTTKAVVDEAVDRNKQIKERLKTNETYRQLSHLEEKFNDLKKQNKIMQESLAQLKKEFDYSELKRQAEEQLADLMEMLRTENNIGL